ncbi:hypothetical protein P8847_20530 [Bacillus inaquosorum]|uniref:hypothetical protein n=1 Tax=Bacillus subtilis group TaxID=653685 RepID=UPI0005C85ADC|nr:MULTISPECIES: hypothetical protein [Bacillus subtilis group]MCY7823841.1 hypothetical protein [Bacillus spizizenii]MED4612123.1 hypothetical protein [Bacillus subtilis]MBJ7570876.1 hypothetical protein [Bacillus halotolerans]MCY7994682.1 hypothetical protein [Bacillus spizizenii]MCY8113539.1 hypothetical protein [Bacillus spizizenii]
MMATKKEKAENAFYIKDLREHSRELFGVRPEVFDGALFHVHKMSITKSEAKKLISQFLQKEVK